MLVTVIKWQGEHWNFKKIIFCGFIWSISVLIYYTDIILNIGKCVLGGNTVKGTVFVVGFLK